MCTETTVKDFDRDDKLTLNSLLQTVSYSGVICKVLPKEEWKEVKNGAATPEEPGQYLVQVLDEQGRGIKGMERVVDCSLLRYHFLSMIPAASKGQHSVKTRLSNLSELFNMHSL